LLTAQKSRLQIFVRIQAIEDFDDRNFVKVRHGIVAYACVLQVSVRLCEDEDHTFKTVCSQQDEEVRLRKCTFTVQLTCPRDQSHVFVALCRDRATQSCPVRLGGYVLFSFNGAFNRNG